jgi:polar amino acid transport system substrate-binding protein
VVTAFREGLGMKYRNRLVVLLCAGALLLAACGDDSGSDAADDDGGQSGGGDFALVSDGELTTCTDAPYEPFEFEGDDGTFTGFDMDLLRKVAEGLDLELSVQVTPFDGIWLRPTSGDCDIVASAMTITEERAAEALFSDPYFEADQSLMIRSEDAGEFATLEDLADGTIGVQTGTTGETYAQENSPEGSELQSYDEPSAMFLALESGDIDAILQDFPVNLDRANQGDEFEVTESFPTGEQYGFAVSQDNQALIDAVNEQLTALRDDGGYDEIFEEYFPGAEAS